MKVISRTSPPRGSLGHRMQYIQDGSWFCANCSAEVEVDKGDSVYFIGGGNPILTCPVCLEWKAFYRSPRVRPPSLPQRIRRWVGRQRG